MKLRDVRCPHCGEEQDADCLRYFVTAWGEDPPKETSCESCEATFWVKEIVHREFHCTKEAPE